MERNNEYPVYVQTQPQHYDVISQVNPYSVPSVLRAVSEAGCCTVMPNGFPMAPLYMTPKDTPIPTTIHQPFNDTSFVSNVYQTPKDNNMIPVNQASKENYLIPGASTDQHTPIISAIYQTPRPPQYASPNSDIYLTPKDNSLAVVDVYEKPEYSVIPDQRTDDGVVISNIYQTPGCVYTEPSSMTDVHNVHNSPVHVEGYMSPNKTVSQHKTDISDSFSVVSGCATGDIFNATGIHTNNIPEGTYMMPTAMPKGSVKKLSMKFNQQNSSDDWSTEKPSIEYNQHNASDDSSAEKPIMVDGYLVASDVVNSPKNLYATPQRRPTKDSVANNSPAPVEGYMSPTKTQHKTSYSPSAVTVSTTSYNSIATDDNSRTAGDNSTGTNVCPLRGYMSPPKISTRDVQE